MNPSTPPGTLRVLRLLLGVAVRRWLNRLSAGMAGKPKPAATGDGVAAPRTATPGKRRGGLVVMVLLLPFMLWSSIPQATRLVDRLAERASGGESVGREVWEAMVAADRARTPSPSHSGPVTMIERIEAIEAMRLLAEVRSAIEHDLADQRRLTAEARRERAQRIYDRFIARGAAAFMPGRQSGGMLPSAEQWPAVAQEPALLNGLSAILLILSGCLWCMTMGSANQDLGKVEWSMEWLFTLPAPPRAILAGKLVEYALINPFLWFVGGPLAFVVFVDAGFGWWALPLCLTVTLYLGVLLASARLLAETWMRLHWPVHRLKNWQASFTLLGLVSFFGLIWLSSMSAVPVAVLDALAAFPLGWNPFSLPAQLCRHDGGAGLAAALIVVVAVLAPWAAVVAGERLVAGGLVAAGGAYQGIRGRPGAGAGGLRGVLGKDLRLLLRDRNFLVQTLIVPVLIVGFQVLMNPGMLAAIAGNFHHAATFAFALGAYLLMHSAIGVLAVEGNALWMLYTFPRRLDRILIDKTLMWAGCAAIYATIVLAVATAVNPSLSPRAISDAAMALVGVVIYAFIAAGLGALATDPLQAEVQRKIQPANLYLFMLLAGMYSYAIYADSPWTKLGQVVLSTLLALALWQKVRDRIPYLLDPTESPPPRIGLSDGLIAALAFFVIQGLVFIMLSYGDLPLGGQMLVAFVTAGAVVCLFSLYIFWRIKVPDLAVAIGLRAPLGRRASPAGAIALGFAAGLAAAVVAVVYLALLGSVPGLRDLRDDAVRLGAKDDVGLWFAGLAVFAAPLFEEYIFRGLVFRGLRRSFRPAFAIMASAGIFAVVHPALAVVPVFGLGCAAAFAFERSGLILAPMIAHATYNALIVAVNWR